MSLPYAVQTLVSRKPQVALTVPGDGMRLFAGYGARQCNEPVPVEIREFACRIEPEPSSVVLKERFHRIARQSVRFPKDGSLPVPPPRQTVASPNPNAPSLVANHRHNRIAGQALLGGDGGHRELTEAIDPPSRAHPDIAFPIFEQTVDDIAGKPVCLRKDIGAALIQMDEPMLARSNPQTSIAVSERCAGIEFAVGERPTSRQPHRIGDRMRAQGVLKLHESAPECRS